MCINRNEGVSYHKHHSLYNSSSITNSTSQHPIFGSPAGESFPNMGISISKVAVQYFPSKTAQWLLHTEESHEKWGTGRKQIVKTRTDLEPFTLKDQLQIDEEVYLRGCVGGVGGENDLLGYQRCPSPQASKLTGRWSKSGKDLLWSHLNLKG